MKDALASRSICLAHEKEHELVSDFLLFPVLTSLLVTRTRTWERSASQTASRLIVSAAAALAAWLITTDVAARKLTDVTYVLNVREMRCFRKQAPQVTFRTIPDIPSLKEYECEKRTDISFFFVWYITYNPLLICFNLRSYFVNTKQIWEWIRDFFCGDL